MRRIPAMVWIEVVLLVAVAWLDQGPAVCPRRSVLARAWRGGLAWLLHVGVRAAAVLLVIAALAYLVRRGRMAVLAGGAARLALALGLAGMVLVGLQRLG